MKGSILGLRATKLSFILITLVCTMFLIWGWDKTPYLVSLLPQSQSLKFTPEIFIGSPVKDIPSDSYMKDADNNRSNSAKNETSDKHEGYDEKSNREDGKNSKEKVSDASVPVGSANTSSVVTWKRKGNFSSQENKQTCDYAKGNWVADDDRPFYSGGRCLQWLSEMWACRLTDRTDFSYEKFRWQPKDCEMEEYSGKKFLRRMRNKTLAFIGDSLGRQQFQSLMCMVSGGRVRNDVNDVGWEYGLVKARGAVRPDGWAYRFTRTNTTILFYWSACLCDLQPLHPSKRNSEVAMHLDRPPAFLKQYLDRFNVIVLNTGHHWNRGKFDGNHWVMHVGGVPTPNKSMVDAKNFTIHSIVKWVDSQLPEHPKLRAFYRSLSPRHFFNGDWNTGGSCDNTNPLSKGKEVLKEESGDPISAMAVKRTNVTFLDITALSELRDEGHLSRYTIRPRQASGQDCLHWCLPGVPDTWNEILFAKLSALGRF
ncbi:protein trichome birefringence-like 14 isoform X1 [Beta vulgaris subsp. vulgaris]|uniref:protein trichome birefringence-like 14 isoform X1 n=1 Tax=Beta vulgaris subsp. vulgaris TaxID=3555 RepID=UPI0020371CA4|nr:protein trichome birefringence-like 14 isoform X1 [Beta vulgaris subsp. vulgaris]